MNYESDPAEQRSGKMSTPVAASTLAGAATGMCCHLTSGVFCGLEELDGYTGIPGLFTAGDGIHATCPSGAAYPCGVGFTSCFTSIDGTHAGAAAAKYAAEAAEPELPQALVEKRTGEITAPLAVEQGYDPNWARDMLHSIMVPYWVSVAKTEETLQAALTQVTYMRDHVVPKLSAKTSHDLRLCIEMKHKVLSAEMKLRASLARRESRGNHYRSDFPCRDDDNFLCYITVQKNEAGDMVTTSVPLPEAWLGDRTEEYIKRYQYYFPGEMETKGFPAPQRNPRGGEGGKA